MREAAAGERFGDRYEILGRLGSGGMGEVFRAYDTRDEREVAIKLFSHAHIPADAPTRLRREFETLSRLSHPNIVKLHSLGTHEQCPFVVMEYVAGDDLKKHLEAGLVWSRAPKRVITVARQICAALDYIHSRDVIHLDLKPSNVLVGPMERVQVTDFGLAARMADLAPAGGEIGLVGTPLYMAPEQFMGKTPDFRSDLFSLGLLLYELAVGRLPFPDEPAGMKIAEDPAKRPPNPGESVSDLPPALEGTILRLLRREREDRIETAQEVLRILDGVGAGISPTIRRDAEAPLPGSLTAAEFVGRKGELEQLIGLLADAVRGEGQVALIRGLPGVGKTRLVRELAGHAGKAGVSRFEVRCGESGSPPLEPVAVLLHRILTWLEEVSGEAVSRHLGPQKGLLLRLLPDFADRAYMADESPPERPAGPAEQQALFETIAGVVVSASQESPLLLIVEDLQWADRGTRQFIPGLADAARHAKIMFVVTIRSGGDRRDEEEVLPAGTRVIDLAPLAPEHSRTLVGSLLSSPEVPREVDEWIGEGEFRTPLYLQEVVRSLAEEGRLQQRRSEWRFVGERDHLQALPEAVDEVIELRSLRLGSGARQMLDCAAAVGEEFGREILEQVCGTGEVDTMRALRELAARQLIQELRPPQEGEEYGFSHSLVREVTYSQIPIRRRRRLHRAIAEALERRAGRPGAEVLAYHYYQGRAWQRAAEYAEEAATRARELYCLDDGLRYVDWSLDALGHLEEAAQTVAAKSRTWRLKGELLRCAGDFRGAAEAHRDGLKWARQSAAREEIARNLNDLGLCRWHLGELHEALGAFGEAREVAAALGDRELQAQVSNSIGLVHWTLSEFEEALEHFRRALDLALALEDARGQGVLYANMSLVCAALGRYEEAIDLSLRGLEIKRARGDRQEEAIALGNLATFYVRLARYDEARETNLAALEIRREIGDRWGEAVGIANAGQILYHLGRHEEAASHLRRAVGAFRELGDRRSEAGNLTNLADAYVEGGELGKAKECVEKALEAAGELDDRATLAFARATLGRWYRKKGAIDEAIREHRAVLELASRIGERAIEVEGRLELAKDLAARGDHAASLEEARAAAEGARSIGMAHELWQALALEAYARWEGGEEARAIERLQEALSVQGDVIGNLHEKRDRRSYALWTGAHDTIERARELGKGARGPGGGRLVEISDRLLRVIGE